MNNQDSHLLYVGNLSTIATKDAIIHFLNAIASVVSVDVVLNDNARSRRCFAIVEMLNSKEVDKVIETLNGTYFQGRVIRVRRMTSVNY